MAGGYYQILLSTYKSLIYFDHPMRVKYFFSQFYLTKGSKVIVARELVDVGGGEHTDVIEEGGCPRRGSSWPGP